MVNNVYGTFVSQKISKIRWKPSNACDSFLTGSWDDEENKIVLWRYTKTDSEDALVKPRAQCSVFHDGDVTELKFMDSSIFAVSSTTGCIKLYSIFQEDEKSQFKLLNSWKKVHSFSTGDLCPSTDITFFEDYIVSVGEDGRIVLISVKDNEPYRIIDNADSCSIRCVSINKMNEILTGNSRGQMKVWDLRSFSHSPETCFTLSGGQAGFTRVTYHPTQTHIKLAGGEDGTITIWDLRNNKFAVNSLNAHSQTVSELMFHPERPEHLFSCSTNGQLWHWDSSKLSHTTISQFAGESSDLLEDTGCPWMSRNVKNRITVYSLIQNLHLPINSLDILQNSVVCGCDNEAMYLIKDFTVS
ncbi:hypothetical protein V9T40_003937 [Parthenolecanium corni]|uniref:EIPR1-like beta-propeller domain-containing protein n=1 Tax=Parthenolecanium corni TaxID=536013 RepID=A0AAN9TG56_9HEMI